MQYLSSFVSGLSNDEQLVLQDILLDKVRAEIEKRKADKLTQRIIDILLGEDLSISEACDALKTCENYILSNKIGGKSVVDKLAVALRR